LFEIDHEYRKETFEFLKRKVTPTESFAVPPMKDVLGLRLCE
jgi:hypothetical protein